jgi:hypothetical protein
LDKTAERALYIYIDFIEDPKILIYEKGLLNIINSIFRFRYKGSSLLRKLFKMLCAPSPGVTWAHVIELVGRAGALWLSLCLALIVP